MEVKQIKLGIIGMGNMGSGHFRNVMRGKCPSVKITAIVLFVGLSGCATHIRPSLRFSLDQTE